MEEDGGYDGSPTPWFPRIRSACRGTHRLPTLCAAQRRRVFTPEVLREPSPVLPHGPESLTGHGDSVRPPGIHDHPRIDALLQQRAVLPAGPRQRHDGIVLHVLEQRRRPGSLDVGLVTDGDLVVAYGTYSLTLTGPEGVMAQNGFWQSATVYQPDGSLKLRLHLSMTPAPVPGM
jgi:hypothetical protein